MVVIGAADRGGEIELEPLLKTGPKHQSELKRRAWYDAARWSLVKDSSTSTSSVLQIVLVISMVIYFAAFVVFPASWVQLVLMDWIAAWWTTIQPDGTPKPHPEMGRPAFLFLFGVVPFAIGTIALELMRGPQNVHRVVSQQVLRAGIGLRRKPSPNGKLGYVRDFSFGELLFLSLFAIGNLTIVVIGWFYLLNYYPLPGKTYTVYTTLEIIGIIMGYNCMYNMAFLFLPATRNSAWMEFMGISYANGMKFHRWLGVATLVTAVAHGLPFYPVWYHDGVLWEKSMPCFDCSLDYFSKGYPAWFNVFGEISLFFMLILAATSLPWIRRNMYETFYYAHYAFVPAVIFAVLHWGVIIWWLLPSFTIYLVDRVISSTNASAPVPIEECSVLGDGILKIVVSRSTQRGGNYEVGQFVYLNIPAISKWQWHAFTIGSSPLTSANSFTIWLKSLGNWTNDLVQYAGECEQNGEQPVIYVDGYYGASLESYNQYGTLCLVGGGIGVTPLFAMLQDIACRVSRGAHWPSTRCIHFVFAFRELALLQEIHPVLQLLRSCEQTRDVFTFEFYLTRSQTDEKLDSLLYRSHCLKTIALQRPREMESTASKRPACPFAEPLRGRTYRAVLFGTVLSVSSAAILYLDFDGGVMMDHGQKTQYWPLQNFVDCMVMFSIAPLAYLFVLVDNFVQKLGTFEAAIQDTELSQERLGPIETVSLASGDDITTYGDLLAEYNVVVGQRPNMDRAVRKVYADLLSSRRSCAATLRGTVGVFVSGPEALKRATETAVASVDSTCFDIHDEEFEL